MGPAFLRLQMVTPTMANLSKTKSTAVASSAGERCVLFPLYNFFCTRLMVMRQRIRYEQVCCAARLQWGHRPVKLRQEVLLMRRKTSCRHHVACVWTVF